MPLAAGEADASVMAHARIILVAYDGSELGRRALDAGSDLMGYGSTLAVVGMPTSHRGLTRSRTRPAT